MKENFKSYSPTPANNFLDQQGNLENDELLRKWKWGETHSIPVMVKCLQWARNGKGVTTFVHYLKQLREWATYEDSYLFFRMYGPSVKQNLDNYLQDISFFYLTLAELFLIRACGLEAVNLQYDRFVSELKNNLVLDAPTLTSRFNAYRSL